MSRAELTPLAVVALAALAERPMHPYEIYQVSVSRRDHRLVKLRPGTLYHAVTRLADQDLVRAVGTEREGNRPERTTYEITTDGRAALKDAVATMLGSLIDEYPVFPFALSEAHNLPTGQVADLLQARLVDVRVTLDELDQVTDHLHETGLPWAFWLHVDYLHTLYRAEATWLEGALADIAAGRFDPRAVPARHSASHHASLRQHETTKHEINQHEITRHASGPQQADLRDPAQRERT